MTTIYLVRHGQKESHAGDPGLTKLGLEQAEQTGRYLDQFPISKIIASPLKRTVETAAQIAAQLDQTYEVNPALVERMNWSDDSIHRAEFIAEWITSTHDRDYRPQWGDSSRSTGERISHLIEKLHTSSPQHVVLVTHGGAIADYLRNHFSEEQLTSLHKQYAEGLDFQVLNCSVTSVLYDQQPKIKLLNYVDHLVNVSE